MRWYIDALKKYAVFSGRSSRIAYWMFVLFDVLFTVAAVILDEAAGSEAGVFNLLYSLATIVPYLAVSVRRMQDSGRSGWWILAPVVNIVFLCLPGDPGANRYGPGPDAA